MAPRRRCHRRRRPGGRVARAGQPHLLPAARALDGASAGARRAVHGHGRRRHAAPRLDRPRQRRSGADRHLLRRQCRGGLAHARRPALAARTGRSSRSTTAVTARARASRASASSPPMRCRSTTPSRRGRASTRSASSYSGAAWAPRWPRTSPRSGRSRAPSWCRRTTASPPSAAITTRGFRFRCCSGTASTREADARRCRMPMLTIVAELGHDHPGRALARALRRVGGAEELAGRAGLDHNSLGATPDFWNGVTNSSPGDSEIAAVGTSCASYERLDRRDLSLA